MSYTLFTRDVRRSPMTAGVSYARRTGSYESREERFLAALWRDGEMQHLEIGMGLSSIGTGVLPVRQLCMYRWRKKWEYPGKTTA